MITRGQYLDGEATHREYYAQFVTEGIKTTVLSRFDIDRLVSAFNADEHLNGIPLQSWDNIRFYNMEVIRQMEECGDGLTLAGQVCILKEAARQIVEEWKENHKKVFDKE